MPACLHAWSRVPSASAVWSAPACLIVPDAEEPFQSVATEYMLQNIAGPASGDGALTTLLLPGVAAVVPIGPRVIADPALTAAHFPLTFVYGGHADWMDAAHAAPVVAAVNNAAAAGSGSAQWGAAVEVLSASGHHVMLDDPPGFNAAILRAADGCRPGTLCSGSNSAPRP